MFSVYCVFFLPSFEWYRTWKLIEIVELGVQQSQGERVEMVCYSEKLNISM